MQPDFSPGYWLVSFVFLFHLPVGWLVAGIKRPLRLSVRTLTYTKPLKGRRKTLYLATIAGRTGIKPPLRPNVRTVRTLTDTKP